VLSLSDIDDGSNIGDSDNENFDDVIEFDINDDEDDDDEDDEDDDGILNGFLHEFLHGNRVDKINE